MLHKGRDGQVSEYYSDDEAGKEGSKEKKGHMNFLESALAAAGLGGAVKALTGAGGHDDKKSDTPLRHPQPPRPAAPARRPRRATRSRRPPWPR